MTRAVAFGFERHFHRERDRGQAGRIAELLEGAPALDRVGVLAAWDGRRSLRTCFRGIVSAPDEPPDPSSAPLDVALAGAVARAFAGRAALSLSGGLDSAVVLAIARSLGLRPPVYVLSARLGAPDYDERDAACALARRLDVEPMVVDAAEEDFVAALPACVGAAETALYNLHPVGRWLLARRAAADGFDALVTGDGADQWFAGAPAHDYLPIVGALSYAAGVTPRSPFLDGEVIACARARRFDPEKSRLRQIAARLPLPRELARASKQSRLAPPLDLARYHDAAALTQLSRALDVPLVLDGERACVRWTTLLLLCREFGVAID
jgi:asparagine synthetase B (glutamine-hydrolysing)